MKKIFALLILCTSVQLFAQQGTLTGNVIDGDFNDALAFANVFVKDASIGTTSDFEGDYTLELEEGTYTIVYSFVGYQTKEVSEVKIVAGQELRIDVTLNPSAGQLDEIIIKTTARKNSESAVLSFQKNSVNLLDGLSLESIKKTGASNIAAAVKNVPGVSIQGGKFVYVRGLGDRYTKSTLNGMDIPGLDPDRNTLQLDLFPTKILENIVVVKSATADQPADFTGGVIDIVTRSIPSSAEYSVNLGVAYNPDFHFNSNYLTQDRSATDVLGFDNGLRNNPIPDAQEIPFPQQNGEVVSILTQRFEENLAAQRESSLMDVNFSATAGNRYDIGDNSLGFFASLAYRNETSYFDQYIDGQIYRKDETDKSNFDLLLDRGQTGEVGNNNVLVSGLLGLTFKSERSKYSFNALHIQNGETQSSIFRQVNGIISSNEVKKDNLIYTQRSVSNASVTGLHTLLEDGNLELEWKFSPSFATIYDKDFRVTPFRIITDDITGEESFVIEPSESGDAGRFWRDLEEFTLPGRVDLSLDHKLFGFDAESKIGAAYTLKHRTFDVVRYSFPFLNFQSSVLNGNPDLLLLDQNIYDPETNSGVYVRRDSSDSDSFESEMTVTAGYVSESFKLKQWMRLVLGVRFEKFDLTYTGERQDGSSFRNAKILDKSDFFPSANLIFDLNEDESSKIRASYSRTTARPSFKEASLAEIFDPISSNTFIGNLNLQPTYIDNFDLRYELYGAEGDFIAFSGFYKSFDDPIELSFIRRAYGQFTPLNLGDSQVIGGEFELRKRLDFIRGLENIRFIANVSIIDSKQEYSDDEREGRLDNLREGETLDDTRQLQGQSPYLLNAGFTFDSEESTWQGGIFYNVQGKTLQIVGAGDIADVYTLPFHNVKLNLSKTFGNKQNSTLSLSFDNLLDDDIESVYQSFGTEDQLYSKWNPGQRISLGYSINF